MILFLKNNLFLVQNTVYTVKTKATNFQQQTKPEQDQHKTLLTIQFIFSTRREQQLFNYKLRQCVDL